MKNNKTNTTAQDLISAVDFDCLAEEQATQIVAARYNTLLAEKHENAGSQVVYELLVATSKHSQSKSPLFAKLAIYCFHCGWEWKEFHADMKSAYSRFHESRGNEPLSAKELSSHSGKWAGFKKREDLWNMQGKSQSPDNELAAIKKTLKRLESKLSELHPSGKEWKECKLLAESVASLIDA